jgi:tetratricopeptide (TPR) repeat protein
MNGVLLALALAVQPILPPPVNVPLPVNVAAAQPPQPRQLMEIPDELRSAFHREVLDATPFPEARLQRLVAFVFGRRGLGVKYRPDATQTVAESFASRNVNCLSSTLLILALSREAGLHADAQQVDQIFTWGATGETVIQSKHVNAIVQVADKRSFIVDVDASDVLVRDAPQPISDEHLFALFYGNRAMELMLGNRLEEASAWTSAALSHSPDDAGLWSNAGVIRLRMGDVASAERYFLKAISLNRKEMSALSNIVALYSRRGDAERANYWQEYANKILRKNPYYQFSLGQQYEQGGRYKDALRKYRLASGMNRADHRFHFGMARAYFYLGEYRKSERALIRARVLADGSDMGRYDRKLAALRTYERQMAN